MTHAAYYLTATGAHVWVTNDPAPDDDGRLTAAVACETCGPVAVKRYYGSTDGVPHAQVEAEKSAQAHADWCRKVPARLEPPQRLTRLLADGELERVDRLREEIAAVFGEGPAGQMWDDACRRVAAWMADENADGAR